MIRGLATPPGLTILILPSGVGTMPSPLVKPHKKTYGEAIAERRVVDPSNDGSFDRLTNKVWKDRQKARREALKKRASR